MDTKQIKWVAEKIGNMVRVYGWIGADIKFSGHGETAEEAICESVVAEGYSFDEAFDVACVAKWTWQE
jgi:hypothetical protein